MSTSSLRVLVFPSPDVTMGSITRCRAVVDALIEHQHQVGVVCTSTTQPWFDNLGISIFKHPEPVFEPALVDGIITVRSLTEYVELIGLANPVYIKDAVMAEIEAIYAFNPNIAFSDFNLTSVISTRLCGISLASTANSPFHTIFQSPLFVPPQESYRSKWIKPFNDFLQKNNLEPIEAIEELYFLRSDIKIVPSCPQLEPFISNIAGTYFVGPLISDSLEKVNVPKWIDEIEERTPLIFVYLSLSDISPSQIEEVIPRSFDGSEFEVVVAFGNDPRIKSLPSKSANVRFEMFIPGTILLQKSDAFIFHGGQNTMVNAIRNEVPSIVFPCSIFERDFNARMMESIGAGIRLEYTQFEPQMLKQTVRALLSQGYPPRAKRVAETLRSGGGGQRVVEILEKHIA